MDDSATHAATAVHRIGQTLWLTRIVAPVRCTRLIPVVGQSRLLDQPRLRRTVNKLAGKIKLMDDSATHAATAVY